MRVNKTENDVCGIVTDDGIRLGPIDLNHGRKLMRLFDVHAWEFCDKECKRCVAETCEMRGCDDDDRDEDLEREREQERFGLNQNAWVTGGHEQ